MFTASVPMWVNSRVWPSLTALATLLTPIVPPAPPTFSTTSCTPRISLIFWQSTRASASVGPPAANGTITVIGLLG
jgi:hypothetical protein